MRGARVPFVQANLIERAGDDPDAGRPLARAAAGATASGPTIRCRSIPTRPRRITGSCGASPTAARGSGRTTHYLGQFDALQRHPGRATRCRCRCWKRHAPRLTAAAGPACLMTADAVGGVWTYALDLARGAARARASRSTLVVRARRRRRRSGARPQRVPGLTLIETDAPLDWTRGRRGRSWPRAGASRWPRPRRAGADIVHLNSPRPGRLRDLRRARCSASAIPASRPGGRRCKGGAPPATISVAHRGYGARLRRLRCARRAERAPSPRRPPKPTGSRRRSSSTTGARRPMPARRGSPRAARARPPAGCGTRARTSRTLDRAAARIDAPVVARRAAAGPARRRRRASRGSRPSGSARRRRAWPPAMSARRVFASPPLYEPFGLAVLEAAQAGLRAGAVRHPDLPRTVGRRGRLRAARRCGRLRGGASAALLRRRRARARRPARRARTRAGATRSRRWRDGYLDALRG